LDSARWAADAVRYDLRDYVAFHRGEEESGVFIAEEIGFSKTGEKSVGVACQCTGAAGKKENPRAGCSWVPSEKISW
jgi:SRSO17 transposase